MKAKLIQVIETEDNEGNLSYYLPDGTPLMQSVIMERYTKMEEWFFEYINTSLPNNYFDKLLYARAQMMIEEKIDVDEFREIYLTWAASAKEMPEQV